MEKGVMSRWLERQMAWLSWREEAMGETAMKIEKTVEGLMGKRGEIVLGPLIKAIGDYVRRVHRVMEDTLEELRRLERSLAEKTGEGEADDGHKEVEGHGHE